MDSSRGLNPGFPIITLIKRSRNLRLISPVTVKSETNTDNQQTKARGDRANMETIQTDKDYENS